MAYAVGSNLAARMPQIGLKHHFAVAGDYNLVPLDQLLTNKDLKQVYCSNKLNCAFSAQGYARAHGAATTVVTFSVGTLSAFDAIGGAHAENLPLILIFAAPLVNASGSVPRIIQMPVASATTTIAATQTRTRRVSSS